MNTLRIIKKLILKFVKIFKLETYIIKNLRGEATAFSRGCPVCLHPERLEIDKKIDFIQSFREVAEEYNFKLDDVVKHFNHQIVKVEDRGSLSHRFYRKHFVRYLDLQEELLKLIDRLNILFSKLEKFDEQSIDVLKTKPTPRDYIASISERRKLIREIKETLQVIVKVKNEIKNEKDLTEILRNLIET